MDCQKMLDLTERLSLSLNSCPLEPQNESICGNQVFAEIVEEILFLIFGFVGS